MKTALLPLAMVFSLAVCAGELPVTDGLTTHIDASGATSDNFELDENGNVLVWKDLAGNGNEFRHDTTGTGDWFTAPNQTGDVAPYYDKDAFDGLGGVRFGWQRPCADYPSGRYAAGSLCSTEYLRTNRTIFVVCKVDPDANTGNCSGIGGDRNYLLSRRTGSGFDASVSSDKNNQWLVNPARATYDPAFYLNGRCHLDAAIGYTNVTTKTWKTNEKMYFDYQKSVPGEVQVLALRNNQTFNDSGYLSLWQTDASMRLVIGRCGAAHSDWSKRMFPGWIGEIITYDRVLTDYELISVENYLVKKWGGDASTGAVKNYAWTGLAGDGQWQTAENWDVGQVPTGATPGAYVVINDAAVEATGEIGWWRLFVSAGGMLSFVGNTTVDVSAGALSELPPETTLAGTFTKTGAGTLKFTAAEGDFSTATLYVKAGKIDIAGGDFTFANVKSDAGVIVNSSTTTGMVAVCAAENETAELGACVCDNVNLVKKGAGTVKLTELSEHTGETRLSGGETKLAMKSGIPALPGLTLHLDATAEGTVFTNEQGCVWKWADVINPDLNFTTNDENVAVTTVKFGLPYSMPTYDKTAFGGKGGIRFGFTKLDPAMPDGVYTSQFLTCAGPLANNKTVFAVVMLDGNATGVPSYSSRTGHILSRPHGSGIDSSLMLTGYASSWCLNSPYDKGKEDIAFWRNGKCYIDRPKGYAAEGVTVSSGRYSCAETGTKDVSQVVVFRTIQEKYVSDDLAVYCGNTAAGGTTKLMMGRTGSRHSSFVRCMFAGWIGEMLIYDHMLTDDQVMAVQKALIKKWGITDLVQPIGEPNGQLSPSSTLCFEKDASLDLNGSTQTVAAVSLEGSAETANGALVAESLVVKAAEDRTVPCLTVDEGWDLTGMSVDFTGKPAPGSVFLRAMGASAFAGPFAETHGWPIKCRGKSVKLAGGGILLLVR